MAGVPPLVTRHLQAIIAERLAEEPVIILNGARTVGKSTLLRACASSLGAEVLDLDDAPTRRAVAADPGLFLADQKGLRCIDEFQRAPGLLDALKSELNRDLRPGRYLLAGSTRYSTLPAAGQSLTGRAHVIEVWPLSRGELLGRRESFLNGLLSDARNLVAPTPSTTTRAAYEQAVLGGGFPIAVHRESPSSRSRWYRDFVDMVVRRDVLEIRRIRQRAILPLALRRLASQTAQVVNAAATGAALGVDRALVGDYIELLEAVFLVRRLEAFGRTLSARTRRMPKIHMVDSGLAAHLMGVTPERLARRDPATLTEFGHLVKTFAVGEVAKQAGWHTEPVMLSHLRTKDGAEVDLVVETGEGRVAGLEIKAAGRVDESDFRGLRWLRNTVGAGFSAGVVLHLGTRSYTHDDRLHALPLDRLWT